MGPKIDPCGTPNLIELESDFTLVTQIGYDLTGSFPSKIVNFLIYQQLSTFVIGWYGRRRQMGFE